MTNKKNGFWRFCFSLIPGAGEMYMGFMKRGVSTMAVFVGIIALASWLGLGPLVCLALIVWFYSFFQVHHLASLPPDQFIQVEDDYLFHVEDFGELDRDSLRRFRQPAAIVLILVGIMLCYQSLYSMVWRVLPGFLREIMDYLGYNVPRLLFGLLVIYVGVRLIQGKRLEMDDDEETYYEERESAGFEKYYGEGRFAQHQNGDNPSAGYHSDFHGERQAGYHGEAGQKPADTDGEGTPVSDPEKVRTVIYMPAPEDGTDGNEK